MPLSRPWQPLERSVLRGVPDRYGIYELADGEGRIVRIDHGPLRDAIKEALAYGEGASQVRYRVMPNKRAARRAVDEHRERLDG